MFRFFRHFLALFNTTTKKGKHIKSNVRGRNSCDSLKSAIFRSNEIARADLRRTKKGDAAH